MNELEKAGFATFVNNGDGWGRIPNAKFMMKDEDGTEIEMTPNEVIKQLMQDNKSLEYCINNLQSKIDKAIEYCEEVIKEHNNGEYNVSTVELAVKEHKENIENVLDILKEDK